MGINNEKIKERHEPESISRISTLKQDTNDFLIIFDATKKLCNEVYSRLIGKDLLYRSVSIYLVDKVLGIHNRSKTIEVPTNSLETFKETVKELLEKFLLESDFEIRRIGVKLSNLTKKEEKQKQITSYFANTKN